MHPHSVGEVLARLAPLLSDACASSGTDFAVGVCLDTRGTIDLATKPSSPGVRLFDSIAGFLAPPEWQAFGVVGQGRARWLHPGSQGGAGEPQPSELVVAHLRARDGTVVTTFGPPGGPYEANSGAPAGLLLDACLRVLSLPTPTAPYTPLEYFARSWLAALGQRPCTTEWSAVARAFPGGGPHGRLGSGPIELADHGRLVALTHGWDDLRRACADGHLPDTEVAPQVAAWMDDHMFARWVCEGPHRFDQLADETLARLAAPVARKVSWVLRAWGLGKSIDE